MGSSLEALPAVGFASQSRIHNAVIRKPHNSMLNAIASAKHLYFNHDGSAPRKLLAGVDKVVELIGVIMGPKGRNVVLQNKYGPPNIVNDGENVLKEDSFMASFSGSIKYIYKSGARPKGISLLDFSWGFSAEFFLYLQHTFVREL